MLPQDSDSDISESFPSSEAHCIINASTGTITPQILTGMDYFNSIMDLHQPVTRLPSGLFLTQTFLGPIISGIVEDFYSTVQNRNGKIYVRFPWKSNKNRLANNYSLALSRLHQLFKMKEKSPECWEEYCRIIEEQFEKRFIEDAPYTTTPDSSTPCYYIPHQAVIKSESSTTKTLYAEMAIRLTTTPAQIQQYITEFNCN
ncbi:hypothetical protein OSTOST_06080, partial [Ostertagia ostertagi]